MVILGDPGAGKSTLLRYLLLKLVQGEKVFISAFPQLVLQPFTIPLYIPLARYAELWHSATPVGERSLENFLSKYLHEEYLGLYTYLVMKQLEQGSVFVLLDGLDEIPDAPLRTQIARQIERFTQTYSKNRFIVTSRIVGYKEASLAVGYQPHTLADFNTNQIRAFTQKWCPAYERWVKATTDSRYLQDAATKEASKLFQATQRNPGVRKLAVNPLLLTILALIQRQHVELPSHRVELFDRCTETLIDTWITAREQSLDFKKHEMSKTLRSLAFWMHQHPAIGAIPKEELLERIVAQLIQRHVNDYEATKIAEQFLSTVRNKMGILVERGEQRYGFLHQTLEEYLAARELVVRKMEQREAFIKKYLHQPRWQEVILLAIGTIGILQENEDEATELVQNAVVQAGSPFEEWLHRDLLFAGRCLGDDVQLNIAYEHNIIEQIVYIYLTSPFDSLREAFSDVLSTWSGTQAGIKATNLIVSLLDKSAILMNTSTISSSITSLSNAFENKIFLHFNYLIEQYKESRRKFVYLRVILILHRLRHTVSDAIKDSLEMLLDPLSDVRELAAFVLGQIGASHPEVVPALLKTLSDSDVRQAAASVLTTLQVNYVVICQEIEGLLLQSKPLTDRQFAADNTVDTLLSALWQIIGGGM